MNIGKIIECQAPAQQQVAEVQKVNPLSILGNIFNLNNEPQFPSLPNDVKEMFDSSTGSDSDQSSKSDKKLKINYFGKFPDTIIFDEEYEIHKDIDVKKSQITICPFCYKIVKKEVNEYLIYSSHLSSYYSIHSQCCERYKAKDMGFKLHSFQYDTKSDLTSTPLGLESSLNHLEDIKVFTQLKVYHPISKIPFLQLNEISYLQKKRSQLDGIISLDFSMLEMQTKLFQTKKFIIPFTESRIETEITVIDPFLKGYTTIELTYEIPSDKQGKITLKRANQDYCILVCGVVYETSLEELQKSTSFLIDQSLFITSVQIKVFEIKSIRITLINLLRGKNQTSTPAIKPQQPQDLFMFQPFTPKTQPLTPLISSPLQQSNSIEYCNNMAGIVSGRGRLPSLNLNEDQDNFSSPTEVIIKEENDQWISNEDITNIDQIKGQVCQFVRTQQGSRLIQKFFTTCTQSELDMIIKEIEDQIPDLMIDPYANYLFGSLSQSCVPSQRIHILNKISPRLIEIACDKKGTHAVQALVSLISSRLEEELIEKAIQNNVVQLVFDSQGTHLIKKIISRFSEDRLSFLFYRIMDMFIQVVNHQYGLCVLKDLMTKFKNNTDKSVIIIKKLHQYIDEIIQDPYGNYAIQHALDVFGDLKCSMIIEKTLQKIVQLSIHKYSSNVVEKCLLETSSNTRKKFIIVLSKEEINLELMKNKFGSFVLQKTIGAAKNDRQLFTLIINSLYRNLSQLYAANIRQKWQDYLDSISMIRKCILP